MPDTPSAELRQAAADLREYHDVMTRSAQLALAKWLDAEAEHAEVLRMGPTREALAVARALLGKEQDDDN